MGGYIIGEDGRICDKREFHTANDAAAVRIAQQLRNRHGIKIWQLDRKVAVLNVDAMQSAASE